MPLPTIRSRLTLDVLHSLRPFLRVGQVTQPCAISAAATALGRMASADRPGVRDQAILFAPCFANLPGASLMGMYSMRWKASMVDRCATLLDPPHIHSAAPSDIDGKVGRRWLEKDDCGTLPEPPRISLNPQRNKHTLAHTHAHTGRSACYTRLTRTCVLVRATGSRRTE